VGTEPGGARRKKWKETSGALQKLSARKKGGSQEGKKTKTKSKFT
jgi:hypothetical protein